MNVRPTLLRNWKVNAGVTTAKSGKEGLSLSSECSVASRSDLLDIQAAVFVQAQGAGAVVVDLFRTP